MARLRVGCDHVDVIASRRLSPEHGKLHAAADFTRLRVDRETRWQRGRREGQWVRLDAAPERGTGADWRVERLAGPNTGCRDRCDNFRRRRDRLDGDRKGLRDAAALAIVSGRGDRVDPVRPCFGGTSRDGSGDPTRGGIEDDAIGQARDGVLQDRHVGSRERRCDGDVDRLAFAIDLIDGRDHDHRPAALRGQHERLRGRATVSIVGRDLDRIRTALATRERLRRQRPGDAPGIGVNREPDRQACRGELELGGARCRLERATSLDDRDRLTDEHFNRWQRRDQNRRRQARSAWRRNILGRLGRNGEPLGCVALAVVGRDGDGVDAVLAILGRSLAQPATDPPRRRIDGHPGRQAGRRIGDPGSVRIDERGSGIDQDARAVLEKLSARRGSNFDRRIERRDDEALLGFVALRVVDQHRDGVRAGVVFAALRRRRGQLPTNVTAIRVDPQPIRQIDGGIAQLRRREARLEVFRRLNNRDGATVVAGHVRDRPGDDRRSVLRHLCADLQDGIDDQVAIGPDAGIETLGAAISSDQRRIRRDIDTVRVAIDRDGLLNIKMEVTSRAGRAAHVVRHPPKHLALLDLLAPLDLDRGRVHMQVLVERPVLALEFNLRTLGRRSDRTIDDGDHLPLVVGAARRPDILALMPLPGRAHRHVPAAHFAEVIALK